MQVCGPVFFELGLVGGVVAAVAYGGHVIGEGVKPDVDDVGLRGFGFLLDLRGDGDSPLEGAAGDGEIFQAAFDEGEDLVAADVGLDGEGAGFDEVDEGLLEGGEAEEEVFFGNFFEEAAAVGAGGADGGVNEGFVGDAVGTGVGGEIDVATVVEFGEELLGALLVMGGGGADEVVVGDAHAVPEAFEGGGDLVGELLGWNAGGCGAALDFLAVLVGAGEEEGVVA